MFFDDAHAPLSLGSFVDLGEKYGFKAGEWYNPTTAMLIVKDLMASNPSLAVVVTRDGVLDASQVRAALPAQDSDPLLHVNRGVLLLMPLRLGLHQLNPAYIAPLIAALAFPQCVGCVGGKPAHSLYFVGSQGANLIFLDPHAVRPSSARDAQAYVAPSPRVMPAAELDPSLSMGFLITSHSDFDDLCARISLLGGAAMFDVVQSPVAPVGMDDGEDDEEDDEFESCRDDATATTSPAEDFVLI